MLAVYGWLLRTEACRTAFIVCRRSNSNRSWNSPSGGPSGAAVRVSPRLLGQRQTALVGARPARIRVGPVEREFGRLPKRDPVVLPVDQVVEEGDVEGEERFVDLYFPLVSALNRGEAKVGLRQWNHFQMNRLGRPPSRRTRRRWQPDPREGRSREVRHSITAGREPRPANAVRVTFG